MSKKYIGIFIILITLILLVVNELSHWNRRGALAGALEKLNRVSPEKLALANEGKLVYVRGRARAGGDLYDETLKINYSALSFLRKVEMYQWDRGTHSEERVNTEGQREYRRRHGYYKNWSQTPIDTGSLEKQYRNPKFRLESKRLIARDIKLGKFHVPAQLIETLDTHTILAENKKFKSGLSKFFRKPVEYKDGFYYSGSATAPRVGDYRIRFGSIGGESVSVIGAQENNGITPYLDESGQSIFLIRTGSVGPEEMLETQSESSAGLLYFFRLLGGFLILVMGYRIYRDRPAKS